MWRRGESDKEVVYLVIKQRWVGGGSTVNEVGLIKLYKTASCLWIVGF